MAKNKQENTKDQKVVRPHRTANIIVCIVAGIAALFIIGIAVISAVTVDPLDGLDRPERYDFYNLNENRPMSTNAGAQSKIHSAVNDMSFSVMSAVLKWNWDYSYNFVRNENGDKIKMTAAEVSNVLPTATAYMVEFVYKPAQIVNGELVKSTAKSLEVDGETVYFDRVKVLIGDTAGAVGEIRLYPYIYDRVYNQAAEDGETYNAYRITAIKVRANTTDAYAALGRVVTYINNG